MADYDTLTELRADFRERNIPMRRRTLHLLASSFLAGRGPAADTVRANLYAVKFTAQAWESLR